MYTVGRALGKGSECDETENTWYNTSFFCSGAFLLFHTEKRSIPYYCHHADYGLMASAFWRMASNKEKKVGDRKAQAGEPELFI